MKILYNLPNLFPIGGKDTARKRELKMASQESLGTSQTVRTRSDSRDRGSSEMPVLSRSNSRSDTSHARSESKERIFGSSRIERSKSEAISLKPKDSPGPVAKLDSRELSKISKSDTVKIKSETKHKTESPDKKLKYTDGEKKTKSMPPVLEAPPPEPEHKEPIKIKLSLAQIRSYSSKSNTLDDTDSASSFEDYEEPIGKKKAKKKDGSSGKKKRYVS